MKNKKINIIVTAILVASQVITGTTVFAITNDASLNETTFSVDVEEETNLNKENEFSGLEEISEANIEIENSVFGPLSLEDDINRKGTNHIRYLPVHIPLGANEEMQRKVFKQSSVVYFDEDEIATQELELMNYIPMSSSNVGEINLKEEKLKTQSDIVGQVYFNENQLGFSYNLFGAYVGRLENYTYVVDYGETLELTYPYGTDSKLSFTLHEREGNNYIGYTDRPNGHLLTVNTPDGSRTNSVMYDSDRPNEELLKFEIYSSEKHIKLGYQPTKSMTVKGSTRKNDVLNFFNDSKVYHNFEVLRIYSVDKTEINQYKYKNGDTPTGPTTTSSYNSDNDMFFEFNRGKMTKISNLQIAPTKKLIPDENRKISRYADEEYLNSTIEEFFENNEDHNITASDMSYVELPKTNVLGKNKTDITVLEFDEKTNKTWQQTYTIPYEVVADSGPQLKTKERDIKFNMSEDELDATIEESFEESSLNEVDYDSMVFETYPDTKKTGRQSGKIKVINEKSAEGNYIDRIYPVYFNVAEATKLEVEFEENPIRAFLGTNPELFDYKNEIKRVTYNEKELKESDYKVEIIDYPSFDYIEEADSVTYKISLVSDPAESITEKIDISNYWGDTIVALEGTSTNDNTISSISLLEGNNKKPYLSPNGGKKSSSSTIRGKSFVNVYRNDDQKPKIALSHDDRSTLGSIKEEWSEQLENADIRYGDVLRQEVRDRRDDNLNGAGTYTAKNERLVKETEKYPFAYYEMTPNGYRLLRLNQLEVNNNVLVFNTGDGIEKINEQATSAAVFPSHITNKEDFKFELTDIDTSKEGKRTGTLKIYEKLASEKDSYFMTTRPVNYVVNETGNLSLKAVTVPVGTKEELLDANAYINNVKVGDSVLDPSEYTASFEKKPNTMKLGEKETGIKVVTKSGKTLVGETTTTVNWGSTVTTKAKNDKTDAAISLLHNNNKPYLMANEGTGFSSGKLESRPSIFVYKDSTEKALISPGYASSDLPAKDTMDKWNNALAGLDLDYGNVLGYQVETKATPISNTKGENTWISRNEELTKEATGYDRAYYEMTPKGFRLLRFNQLEVSKNILSVPLKTSDVEMNQKASEMIVFPSAANKENYRFEFTSVDTKTSGKKKSKLNVYEKLENKKEFMSTMDVEYIVNPQVEEKFYDEAGKEIKTTKISNFDLGKEYQPKPENFISSNNEVYIYKGWLKANEEPGTDTPRTGQPDKVTKEDSFHYIYEKSEKHINVTIPTEMLFGTENGKDVTSKDYEIKNNSNKVKTEVSLNEFKKETSEVKLLTSKEKDPTKTAQSARLNLTTNGQTAVGSLNDTTKNESITTLKPGEKASMGISGKYFGSQKESARIKYNMMLKFTVVPD